MKNLIILLLFALSLPVLSQTYDTPITNDTLFVADQTATDSVYFKRWRAPLGGSITFDFTFVDATDAVLTFGYSPDGVRLVPVPVDPETTLDNTDSSFETYDVSANVKYCKSYTKDNWSYRYIGWMFSKGSLTNDTIAIMFTK